MQRTLMILVSGTGSTLENLCAKIHHKKLNAKINCVIANHANIAATDVAIKWNLPYWILDCSVYPPRDKWNSVFQDLVDTYEPGLIIAAGFDRLIKIPYGYEERVLNIHPSLLPKHGGKWMYGNRVHKSVLESKDTLSGCTVHVCDGEYDKGKIIAQDTLQVSPTDTILSLKKRVQQLERSVFPKAIEMYLNELIAKNIY